MRPRHPAIYVRISDDREGESKGVSRQLVDCRAIATARGWPDPAVYNDNDKSAWKRTVVREDFQRLLTDISNGTVDALIVYDSDRFYRQPRELEEFLDVCESAKVTQLTQVTGDVDLGSTDGRLTLRIKAAVAVKESDDKSRRIKRKALELAEQGKISGGGTRPFGFESDRKTIRSAEAQTIRDLARRFLAGESTYGLCMDLNERGIPTPTGGTWVTLVLTRMLKSARISGRREHHGEIVADAEWEAIISPEQSDRIRAILSDPARRKNRNARRYLLAGMVRCGNCGKPLVSRPRDDGKRRYVCAKRPGAECCGRLGVVADELEELVVEMVMSALDSAELATTLSARAGIESVSHQQEADTAAGQLDELAAAFGNGNITMQEWLTARAPIEARLTRAKAELVRSSGAEAVVEYLGNTSSLRSCWDDLPLAKRRAILSAVLAYVIIAPGRRGFNRFDPGRVAFAWPA